jgi:peptidoglycan/xylan/chitin deacetylase (PgdA/CDA1 family)
MNNRLKILRQLLALLFRFLGLPFLIREIFCRRRATIIVYHDPAPEVFEAHLAYLVDRFNIIPLEQLVEAIEEHDWQKIPPKGLCITFDDGHRGNFALLDIIKRYKVPITIYVCAGIVDTQRLYWFLDFADQAQQLKSLPNKLRLKQLASANCYNPEKDFAERQALSKAEVLDMKRQGVDFQSHTLLHPILTTCTDEECWLEIAGAKRVLENLLEESIVHFAYPNGDYSEREIAYLQKAGYRSARTIDMGWNGPNTNIYALKSMTISDDATLDEMIAQLCGIFPYFRYLRQGSFTGKHTVIQN